MTTVMNDKAEALPPKDFLIKDYELKVRYLTDHFGVNTNFKLVVFTTSILGEQFARGGSIPTVPFVTHQYTWEMFARILLGLTSIVPSWPISVNLARKYDVPYN